MYLKHCKLSRNKQLELMKYFVAGSTAGTAADLAGIHGNTAIRFFHKLRCVIAHKQQRRPAQFTGEIELDESCFGGVRKGNVVVVRRVKSLSLVSSNAAAMCTHKSLWMQSQIR